MAQITIDDIEYNTEDFTDKETALFKEIQYNAAVQKQLTYQLQCVTAVSNNATGQLKDSLTTSISAPDDAAS